MAAKVADYNFLAIPVVDHEHHLVGIITHDDVIDVLREETEEDAYRAAASRRWKRPTSTRRCTRCRGSAAFGCAILLAASLLTVIALQSFDETLRRVNWLPCFLPLIVSCGGNSGGQSATLIITALTSGDLHAQGLVARAAARAPDGADAGRRCWASSPTWSRCSSVDGPSPVDKLVVPDHAVPGRHVRHARAAGRCR